MLDTLAIYEELAKTFGPDAAKALASVLEKLYREIANTVSKQDFQELREALTKLTQAQQRTEQRVEELATAQQRTEQRLEELATAQQRTEQRLEELAQAQQRTEQRLEELAQAQQRTEQRVEELASGQRALVEAQARTEEEVRKLAKGLRETRQMVGGLSDAVGYGLEDRAIVSLPRILPDRAGVTVDGKLSRRWVRHAGGRQDELNIFGKGHREDGSRVTILGEAKARLKKHDVDTFVKLVSRLKGSGMIEGEPFLLMVSYQLHPDVEAHAREHGVLVIPSYELAYSA
ncbi:MAG: hypothetical protein GXP48_02465 [Acidobacteria bacterium]|nr:hypothetical protein [Acidobacteriota bacterium]